MRLNILKSLIILLIFISFYLIDCKPQQKQKQISINIEKNSQTKLEIRKYVGRDSCIKCHEKEYNLWKGSDHDLAMQKATGQTVLGNFNNSVFTQYGITSRFYRRGNKFLVFTEGPGGNFAEFEIEYTFGIRPLQQYLVKFPNGRYQVLPLCWDTRPSKQGGQRWFHIYPNERIKPEDVLYWSRVNQNWNYMCAECHSTNVRKNYDFNADTYNTKYSEIDVSCEACHGPGSKHIIWARSVEKGKRIKTDNMMGLLVQLKDPNKGTWIFNMETGNVHRTVPLKSHVQIEICARCHARRSIIHEEYIQGKPLLDTHVPALLSEGLYFSDGQIKEEVYVYGSFLQSKMYQKGVLCHDCHEPHSMKVYAQGNVLCYRCHLREKFGVKSHHFHNPDSTGALCVECHMPERTYMVVDPRRDHSIRIPRPDLSEELETPNACNQCHKNKSNKWSVYYIKKWYGEDLIQKPHYGEVLNAGNKGLPDANILLAKLISDTSQANIVRASALRVLDRFPSSLSAQVLKNEINHRDPLIRLAALGCLDIIEPIERLAMAKHLLQDPIRAVRNEAVLSLSSVSPRAFSPSLGKIFEEALSEYIECHMVNAEHYITHINLGNLYLNLKQYDQAEESYKTAIRLEPNFIYSYINLADFYRVRDREDEGERILRKALEIDPKSSQVYHALGLLLVRKKKTSEALINLKKAVLLDPDNPNYSYVYGIGLNSIGKVDSAINVLERALKRRPYNQELLFSLVTIQRDCGNIEIALKYAQQLVTLAPQNSNYKELLNQLVKIKPD